jgi:hypothetical protein
MRRGFACDFSLKSCENYQDTCRDFGVHDAFFHWFQDVYIHDVS